MCVSAELGTASLDGFFLLTSPFPTGTHRQTLERDCVPRKLCKPHGPGILSTCRRYPSNSGKMCQMRLWGRSGLIKTATDAGGRLSSTLSSSLGKADNNISRNWPQNQLQGKPGAWMVMVEQAPSKRMQNQHPRGEGFGLLWPHLLSLVCHT